MRSRKLRPLVRAARSLTVGSARDSARPAHGVSRAAGPAGTLRPQARGCAVAQSCSDVGALARQVRNLPAAPGMDVAGRLRGHKVAHSATCIMPLAGSA